MASGTRELSLLSVMSALIIGGFTAAATALAVIFVSQWMHGGASPPLRIISAEVVTPVVEQGEPFQIRILAERADVCPSEVDGFLRSDGVLIRLPTVTGGWSSPGRQNFIQSKPTRGLDAFGSEFILTPGHWTYSSVSRHYCDDAYPTLTRIPPADGKPLRFTVKEN